MTIAAEAMGCVTLDLHNEQIGSDIQVMIPCATPKLIMHDTHPIATEKMTQSALQRNRRMTGTQ